MTKNQNALYWREWSAVRKASPASDRHDLHIQALGDDKSHVDFDNDDFDKVLAAFRAISQPGNLNAQLHALNGQRKRLMFGIRKLARSMDAGEAYVQGIIDRMDARRGEKPGDDQDAWERERERDERPRRKLEELHPRELTKVMVALRKHEKRGCVHAHTSPDVRTSNSQRVGDFASADVGTRTDRDPF